MIQRREGEKRYNSPVYLFTYVDFSSRARLGGFSIKFSFSLGISSNFHFLLSSIGRCLIVSLNRYKGVDHHRNITLGNLLSWLRLPRRSSVFFIRPIIYYIATRCNKSIVGIGRSLRALFLVLRSESWP